jgi:hypothetical protein
MPINNGNIINKAAIATTSITHGLLNPEQARKFIQQTFEATNLAPLVRHVMRQPKSGEIDKIGIASRIIRGKKENSDDGYRAGVATKVIEYACKAVRLPWEITEETLRENIEGQQLEAIITNLMTAQIGVDMEDLYLNGDERAANAKDFSSSDTYAVGDYVKYNNNLYTYVAEHTAGSWNVAEVEEVGSVADIDFLKLNDGWIKQIGDNGHVYDASSENVMKLDIFYKMLQKLPNKYNNGKLRWLMSPKRAQEWELYLMNQVIEKGGAIPDNVYTQPVHIPTISCPSLGDDKIILTDPKNLVVVNTYDMKIRKTTEGKEAIMQDKRFYVCHMDYDAIIEETDATGIITGLPSLG